MKARRLMSSSKSGKGSTNPPTSPPTSPPFGQIDGGDDELSNDGPDGLNDDPSYRRLAMEDE